MKILVCAAGSAGHIYPALSFLLRLKKQSEGLQAVFLTSRRDIERKFLKESGFTLRSADLRGVPRRNGENYLIFSLKIFLFLIKFICESVRILFLINDIKPDVIVGFGGIICLVPVTVSKLFGIPSLLHEQNIVPGRAVKFLARFADKIAVGFKETKDLLKNNNVYYTGNPLPSGLMKIGRQEAREKLSLASGKFTLFVFGGSQGSEFINYCLPMALEKFPDKVRRQIQVLHAAGAKQCEAVKEKYRVLNVEARVVDYIFEMSDYYCAADLVVSRAGAGTLNELNFFGRAAVLIPYPYAGSHQQKNAEFMETMNAAVLITQDNDCPDRLYKTIDRLREERLMIEKMSQSSSRLFKSDSVISLVNLVLSIKRNEKTKRLR